MTHADHVQAFLSAHVQQIAVFAQTSHSSEGRGVVRIGLPQLPTRSGTIAIERTNMVYHRLDEIRTLAGHIEDGATLIRMIETYNPSEQAVVIAAFAGQNPVSVKLRLEPPFLVMDPASGVH